MNNISRLTVLFLLVFSPFLLSVAHAESATEQLRIVIDEVRAAVLEGEKTARAIEQIDKQLEAIIEPLFDFREMSKRSLGTHWGHATQAEQEEFVSLFSALLKRNYLAKIRDNVAESSVNYVGETVRDKKALVRTLIVDFEGEEVTIDYRLYERDGAWRIYDVIIANVGLVSNYRNEFAGIVRKEKIPGLLQRLKEKNAENRD